MSVFEVLRERVDLIELAGRYTEMAGSGSAQHGRCPYPDHEDRNPSFHVYPDRRFHCYGCGRHGDVADLWAATNGLEAGIGAALSLAREYGIGLPDMPGEARELELERRHKEERYASSARKYHAALDDRDDVGAWWTKRGFDEESRRRFLLGVDEDAAVIPFWNRGRVQGLIRRKLEGEPKYRLPRAEKFVTGHRPLFVPGPLRGESFLVEGYVDALALTALGHSAVAVGGTNISEHQMRELRRLPGPLYILPDADEAGAKAARGWAEDLYPKALLCPPDYEKEKNDD